MLNIHTPDQTGDAVIRTGPTQQEVREREQAAYGVPQEQCSSCVQDYRRFQGHFFGSRLLADQDFSVAHLKNVVNSLANAYQC